MLFSCITITKFYNSSYFYAHGSAGWLYLSSSKQCKLHRLHSRPFVVFSTCLHSGAQTEVSAVASTMLFFFFFLIFLFFFKLIYYLWPCWVFVSVRGLSLVAASGGRSSSRCAGLSLSRPLLLRSTGSRRAGSVVVAHGPSCSAACGIFPDQGSNPRPLHWQADSQLLRHQGSPLQCFSNSRSQELKGKTHITS